MINCELTSARLVPHAVIKNGKMQLFECQVDEKTKDAVYLQLSPVCVATWNLKSGMKIIAEIRFSLNRQTFCEMHESLDFLADEVIEQGLFPSFFPLEQRKICEKNDSEKNSTQFDWTDAKFLNPQQQTIIQSISSMPRKIYPFVITGPFGTGKSLCFAYLTKFLLHSDPTSRILLCTQSNSAADLYIREYFHQWVLNNQISPDPLRIYYEVFIYLVWAFYAKIS